MTRLEPGYVDDPHARPAQCSVPVLKCAPERRGSDPRPALSCESGYGVRAFDRKQATAAGRGQLVGVGDQLDPRLLRRAPVQSDWLANIACPTRQEGDERMAISDDKKRIELDGRAHRRIGDGQVEARAPTRVDEPLRIPDLLPSDAARHPRIECVVQLESGQTLVERLGKRSVRIGRDLVLGRTGHLQTRNPLNRSCRHVPNQSRVRRQHTIRLDDPFVRTPRRPVAILSNTHGLGG